MEGAPEPTGGQGEHLRWTIDRYRNSSAWAVLSTATRRQRENIFRAVINTAGDEAVKDITAETIRAGRERRAARRMRRTTS